MAREPHIPLFLWIATALLVHLTGGEGAQRASDVLGERLEVQRFADAVRRHVQGSSRPIEVALLDSGDKEEADRDSATPDETEPDQEKAPPKQEPPKTPDERRDNKKADEQQVKVEPKPDEEPQPEKPKAPEQKKPPEQKKADQEQREVPTLRLPNRIAVVQHVEDQNQKDNPNAEFIADQANHVKEQTQSRVTATDQNDPNPTPGSAPQGPPEEPGNSQTTDIAHSEDSPGAIDHAPNEKAAGQKAVASIEKHESGASKVVKEVAPDSRQGRPAGADKGQRNSDAEKAQAERKAVAASRETPESPEVVSSPNGSQPFGEKSEARMAQEGQSARKKRLPPPRGKPDAMDFLGLGASGTTAGGINLNLSPGAAIAAVGRDQLSRERVADGERRRSTHRGSWRSVGMEKWRAAIENYNSSVKPGNQTALNAARVPFAGYLNQIHNRLHPIFADSFLGSLEGLPADHPLNKKDMRTNLEIVLDRDEGKIVKMGVTRSSGSTIFDVAALESVQNAAPFGKPPPIIVSPDGNVYLHWEFYREPFYACSTYFAHPYLLKASPENAPTHVPPPSTPPFGPREQPLPEQGALPSDSAEQHAAR